jgi:hypothetical protein
LKVVASGSSLKFYANNVLLKSFTDTSLNSGQLGVMTSRVQNFAETTNVDWATAGGPQGTPTIAGEVDIMPAMIFKLGPDAMFYRIDTVDSSGR